MSIFLRASMPIRLLIETHAYETVLWKENHLKASLSPSPM